MKIVSNMLDSKEYYDEVCRKKQIVLHHTVSKKGHGLYVKDTFSADQGKSTIAVPYIIDINDTVYKLFEPDRWAYHLGIKGMDNIRLCQDSIAIEIVNEGPLKKVNNKYYWFDGKQEYHGEVYEHSSDWRGFRYFAKYDETQYKTIAELIKLLCDKYNINKSIVKHFNYDVKLLKYEGIIMHSNVRADKTDLHPGFNIELLQKQLNIK